MSGEGKHKENSSKLSTQRVGGSKGSELGGR